MDLQSINLNHNTSILYWNGIQFYIKIMILIINFIFIKKILQTCKKILTISKINFIIIQFKMIF